MGSHIIADISVNKTIFETILNKRFYPHFDERLQLLLIRNKMSLINKIIHFFDGPCGSFTAVYLLEESHLSFHSWPEYNYIAVDIFTSGNSDPRNIINDISVILEATKINIHRLERATPR